MAGGSPKCQELATLLDQEPSSVVIIVIRLRCHDHQAYHGHKIVHRLRGAIVVYTPDTLASRRGTAVIVLRQPLCSTVLESSP